MDENPTATTTADTSALLISEPTSEVNEKPLATSVSIPYPDVDDKVMNPDKDQPQQNEPIPEDLNEIKASEFSSPVGQIDPDDDSSPTIISAVLETLLTQIECNLDPTLTTLAVIEDGQMELDDDAEDDEMDDEEEVETDTTTNTNRSTKSSKAEDERTAGSNDQRQAIDTIEARPQTDDTHIEITCTRQNDVICLESNVIVEPEQSWSTGLQSSTSPRIEISDDESRQREKTSNYLGTFEKRKGQRVDDQRRYSNIQ